MSSSSFILPPFQSLLIDSIKEIFDARIIFFEDPYQLWKRLEAFNELGSEEIKSDIRPKVKAIQKMLSAVNNGGERNDIVLSKANQNRKRIQKEQEILYQYVPDLLDTFTNSLDKNGYYKVLKVTPRNPNPSKLGVST